jgi:hypothetical protein
MKQSKHSKKGFIWTVLAVVILVAVWYFRSDLPSPASAPATPSSAPTVFSVATQPADIGNQTKTTGCISDGVLPDPACTPGAIDPKVTQELTGSTICVVGYSSSVRPDTSVTNKIKIAQFGAYGLTGQPMSDYELDHLISLELGGCADCVANLWPEPYAGALGAREKDKVENYLHQAVCKGQITLAEAQREIATDWTAVYKEVYGH